MFVRRLLLAGLLALFIAPLGAWAADVTPAQAAETLRSSLLRAQLDLARDPQSSQAALATARSAYDSALAPSLEAAAPAEAARIAGAWDSAGAALAAGDAPAFAGARARIWTGVLGGSYRLVEQALAAGDGATAQRWLALREFRVATRFSRPAADATL
ncbi:MAG TPA: iron permease, partial [Herpetosiphonaceae bacterium]|nr:iron permease [Herpetosiphonaceae bacterium]